jgi:hypothetical protein
MAATAHAQRGPSPAQVFCGLFGLVLVAAGALGFLANSDFGGPEHRGTFIGLDVNGWHNVVHVATGLLLLAGAPSATAARAVCAIFGVTYAVVAVLGIIDGSDVLGLIPVDGADNVLHSVLAVLALGAAAAPAPGRTRRSEDEEAELAEIARRYHVAYDASSPKQVFVGVRGS